MERYPLLMAPFTRVAKLCMTVILDLIWLDRLTVLVLSVGGLERSQCVQVSVLALTSSFTDRKLQSFHGD